MEIMEILYDQSDRLFKTVPEFFLKEFLEKVEDSYCTATMDYTPQSLRLPSIFEVVHNKDFEEYLDDLSSHILLGDTMAYNELEGEQLEEFYEKADGMRDGFHIDAVIGLRFFCFAYQDYHGRNHYSPLLEVW